MTQEVLSKYSGQRPGESASHSELASLQEAEATDDLAAFGWLRGVRDRAQMLELRKKDGNILAVGYGWLERVEFDPSEGIMLHVGSRQIRIKGRNLNAEIRQHVRLFEGITRHRVPWVQESDRKGTIRASSAEPVIELIEW